MNISFEIPGRPVPQERPIHLRSGWAYDPPKSKAAKRIIRGYAIKAASDHFMLNKPSDRSFIVHLDFMGPHWGADIDNLTKLVLDAVKGIFWRDDHQVIEIHARKMRCPKGQEKTIVRIEEVVPRALVDLPNEKEKSK